MAQNISVWRRALWHLYRSPAAPVIKTWRRQQVRAEIAKRRALAAAQPVSALEKNCAITINREGYAVVTDAIDPRTLVQLAYAGQEKYQTALRREMQEESNHKSFWTRLLDEDMRAGALPVDNPFVAFALQPAILSILSHAYGELPQLDSVLLALSRPTDKPLSYSQLWHRDHDDTRVIKVFVYLTDVTTQADGPFTFLPGPVSDRFGFALKSHRPDAAILRRVQTDEIKSMLAPRLSVFMVETTRCMHMGSRLAPGHERLLYTATYISVPRLFPEPPSRFQLTGQESETVRCVLTPAYL